MGRKASAAACAPAAQILLWALCSGGVLCFPQPPSASVLPVRYPGGHHRPMLNDTLPRSIRPNAAGGGRMVVFPDDSPTNSLVPVLDMNGNPTCVHGLSKASFCENVTGYPTNEIRRLVQIDKTTFQDLFGPVMAGVDSRKNPNPEDFNEEGVCKHQRHTFYPKMARNDKNFWRYVINDVDYVQAVEAEVCQKEGKECSYVQDRLPGGHQSICRQRFSFKRLLAIDPDQKKSYIDSFRFASCCSCYVKVPTEFRRLSRGRSTTQFPPTR